MTASKWNEWGVKYPSIIQPTYGGKRKAIRVQTGPCPKGLPLEYFKAIPEIMLHKNTIVLDVEVSDKGTMIVDAMSSAYFDAKSCPFKLSYRLKGLEALFSAVNDVSREFFVAPHVFVNDRKMLDATVRNFKQDYEGCILKDPDSLYIFGKSDAWMKCK